MSWRLAGPAPARVRHGVFAGPRCANTETSASEEIVLIVVPVASVKMAGNETLVKVT